MAVGEKERRVQIGKTWWNEWLQKKCTEGMSRPEPPKMSVIRIKMSPSDACTVHAWQFLDWKILGVVRSSSICSRIFLVSSSYWFKSELTFWELKVTTKKSHLMDSLLVFWNGIFKWLHNVAEVLWCQAKARIWITGKCLHNPEKWLETTTN